MRRLILLLIISLGILSVTLAQHSVLVKGIVLDEMGESIPYVNISVPGQAVGTTTDMSGKYRFTASVNDSLKILYTSISYSDKSCLLYVGDKNEIVHNVTLGVEINQLPQAIVEDKRVRKAGLVRLNPKISQIVPSVGGIETLVMSLPGVSSKSELSSQYSVRGGNFDENLVYVNDIQIYRPVLIRSGQQEGLSFVNSDLVSSLMFSAGGFDATYGDKMSSVLDIKYRKPTKNAASFTASLLGGSMHVEGVSKTRRFRYLFGARYKTNKYLLSTLDTEAQYDPNFADIQSYITYDVSDVWEMSFLGHFGKNTYRFIPEVGETSFGTVSEAYKLKIYFDGQEEDSYSTGTGAITARYHKLDKLNMKFIFSGFYTKEQERFDILGQYYLNSLETSPGEEDYGDSITNVGVGSFLNHANNKLNASVLSLSHIGTRNFDNHTLKWGGKLQTEDVDYILKEWEMVDSSGYSLPYSDELVLLSFTDTSNFDIFSHRAEAYIQDAFEFEKDSNEYTLVAGLRGNYWSFNQQFLISPRFSFSMDPNWSKDMILRISGGVYNQPPFFKEVIRQDGSINNDIKAQSSVQVVFGGDYVFQAWGRPFKFMTEVYYKYLWNIIPYDIDNVRIRYYGENMAVGYATGIDLKVNGEFVKGTESWFSLSLMKTMEDIDGDSYVDSDGETVYPGYLRRPTDQRVNFNVFFQDYLPGNPTWKAHLNLVYGTGLPFGPPNTERYMATGVIPAYRRVDVGLSKRIIGPKTNFSENSPFRFINDFWISLEAFNLLDINNTISYIWITDVYDRQYAVPNYLTGRRLNLKMHMSF
jgi:hypothetical protein